MQEFKSILLKNVPVARALFLNSGFELDQHFSSAVEGIRARPSTERSYQAFLDEVLRETLVLKNPWTSASRKSLPTSERSEYLDYLASIAGAADELSLDPNFNLFLRAGMHRSLATDPVVAARKEIELKNFLSSRQEKEEPLLESFDTVAEKFSLQRTSRSRTQAEWTAQWSNLKMKVCIAEVQPTEKWSMVMASCVFDAIPGKDFGLNDFLAGSLLYTNQNKTLPEKIFSFHSQCMFFSKLAELLDTESRAILH